MSCCCCDLAWYAFVAFLVVQLFRLIFADADLTLLWKFKYGSKPGIFHYPGIIMLIAALI
jgi:dehydrogenase/reductase SDR family protein 7